jgi:hypothetical protein
MSDDLSGPAMLGIGNAALAERVRILEELAKVAQEYALTLQVRVAVLEERMLTLMTLMAKTS